jgi:hypothetical protein
MGVRSNDHQLVAGKQYYDNEVQAVVSSDYITIDAGDTTPDVSGGTIFSASTGTITTFDGGVPGQKIHIVHTGATDFDVTGTTLKGGSTDITGIVAGDMTSWVYNGTNWYLVGYLNVGEDYSGGH